MNLHDIVHNGLAYIIHVQAGVDGAGIDVPGSQPPPGPQDHQSNPVCVNVLLSMIELPLFINSSQESPTTSSGEATENGPGEKLNIKPEAADIHVDPHPSLVKPKVCHNIALGSS